jgi:arylsulfatase A-like enzyme
MLDQLNYRCLGYMDHPDVKTPNVDSLAADGTYFTSFYTTSPICQPSRISFLTGQYQKTHRQYGFEGMVDPRFKLLPKIFKQNGFTTGASGKFHINSLGSEWGFDYLTGTLEEERDRCRPAEYWYPDYIRKHGFRYPTTQTHGSLLGDAVPENLEKEHKSGRVHEINIDNYVNCAGTSSIPFEHSIEKWTTDRALEFLENKTAGQPFFYWLTYDRPHAPHGVSSPFDKLYDPSKISLTPYENCEQICSKPYDYFEKLRKFFADNSKLRKVLAAYYSIISCIDSEIGRVINHLKQNQLYDSTTIIFTSDHGDMAGMHCTFEKDNMTDDILRIPLIIKPALIENLNVLPKVDVPCESIDIMPTLLTLHDLDCTKDIDGRDISFIFHGKLPDKERSVLAEQYSIKAVVKSGWKLVYYLGKSCGMLFDLNTDPYETTNLYEHSNCFAKRLELKNELISKLAGTWNENDVEDVEKTIFNFGPRSAKVHYGNIGWDNSDFYVTDYRCMYAVQNNPSTHIMMYRLYNDQRPVYKFKNGCPDYNSGGKSRELINSGLYEKLIDGLINWLIRRIAPIDVIGVQASKLPADYPSKDEVAEFLNKMLNKENGKDLP